MLLGPLGVEHGCRARGSAPALMQVALNRAPALLGHAGVILVGDPEYYERFGFVADPTSGLVMPAPVERRRFLGHELVGGSLKRAEGQVAATGIVVTGLREAA